MTRLSEEVKAMRRRGVGKVFARLEDDQTALVAIPGPENSDWAGGLYSLIIKCPKDYPSKTPSVRFVPPIPHPNVTESGSVSIPYLDRWGKKSTLAGLITAVYKILDKPLIEEAVNLHAVYEFSAQSLTYKSNARQAATKLGPGMKHEVMDDDGEISEEIEIVEFDENPEVAQVEEPEPPKEEEKNETVAETLNVKPVRRGCQKQATDDRARLQEERVRINFGLARQMKILTGAENLYRATANAKVKETVALELNFVEASVDLLKEELIELNGMVREYQSTSETVVMPMISIGLKETESVTFDAVMKDFILEHYSEDGDYYCDEIADFNDLRDATMTPSRDEDGVDLLFEYYNQLYFIDNRFFPPSRPLGVFLSWYDSLTGLVSIQKTCAFEKASVLFNIGALFTQIGSKTTRLKRDGIEDAIESFQHAAGAFNYIRLNFSNAPTADMSPAFLNTIVNLMLAQAQEALFEKRLLGGVGEAGYGKLVDIAGEAAKVSEKYRLVESVMGADNQYIAFIPPSWTSMVQIKTNHYKALSHYFLALALNHSEFGSVKDPLTPLKTAYASELPAEFPSLDEICRRKSHRRQVVQAHLQQASHLHEVTLQKARSSCRSLRGIGALLGHYLRHATTRTEQLIEAYNGQELISQPPDISPRADTESETVQPNFSKVKVTDIFKKLGPMAIFSARNRFSAPRIVKLNRTANGFGFTVRGDSPVLVANVEVDGRAARAGFREGDVITKVNGKCVKWARHSDVIDMFQVDKLEIEIVTVQGIEVAPQAVSGNHHERSHSRPTAGGTGARQRPKNEKKGFFGSFGRQKQKPNVRNFNAVY